MDTVHPRDLPSGKKYYYLLIKSLKRYSCIRATARIMDTVHPRDFMKHFLFKKTANSKRF